MRPIRTLTRYQCHYFHYCAFVPAIQSRETFLEAKLSRNYSSGQTGNYREQTNIDFKSQLRSLYKLIHPDVLHKWPEARVVNEKSFQSLQDYLQSAKRGDLSSQSSFHFSFFINESDSLKRVEVTVRPPSPGHINSDREFPLASQLVISKLLEACGLKSEDSPQFEKLRLSKLFRKASEVQKVEDAWVGPADRHIIVIRNALRMGRGVVATFKPPILDSSAGKRIELLQRLGNCLDRVPAIDLRGCSVIIGDGQGVDPLGNIWLDHGADSLSWSQLLLSIDVEAVKEGIKACRYRRGVEAAIARQLEIEMLFTDDLTSASAEYGDFIARMKAGVESFGALGQGRFASIPVQVLPAGQPFGLETSSGIITVPISATYEEVEQFLERKGPFAQSAREAVLELENRVKEMSLRVRKKLKLRHLTSDGSVTAAQFMDACTKLLLLASQLESLVEGLSICVSDRSFLPSKGKSILYLDWKFDVSDM